MRGWWTPVTKALAGTGTAHLRDPLAPEQDHHPATHMKPRVSNLTSYSTYSLNTTSDTIGHNCHNFPHSCKH